MALVKACAAHHTVLNSLASHAQRRQTLVAQARRAVLHDGAQAPESGLQPWITHSWRRCLSQGLRPEQGVAFNAVSAQAMRRVSEASHSLVQAARPVVAQLAQALAATRYFAVLTDAQGIVVDVHGPIDRSDPRAHCIARIGVDLSERAVGTTAIGAALAQLHPVWLHRGEHFFNDTMTYSCAGAPLFGPDGACVGMLDLTGVDVPERPELMHLVSLSARSIEHGLLLRQPHALVLRLNWPGHLRGDESDGLLCLDASGYLSGANQAARQLLALAPTPASTPQRPHCDELFGLPFEMLFDRARRNSYGEPSPMDVPLWSGLRLQVLPMSPREAIDAANTPGGAKAGIGLPLKDIEIGLIRQAVADAKGNVMQAATALGISRATVYRKLGKR